MILGKRHRYVGRLYFEDRGGEIPAGIALFSGMGNDKRPPKANVDDPLFQGMGPELQALNRAGRRKLRVDARSEWAKKHGKQQSNAS